MTRNNIILLVEDNEDDIDLTLRAFEKSKVAREVVVARNGEEGLDYLFGQGKFAGRDTRIMPDVVLLDIKLPKVDGLETLRRLRADPRTRRQPVVILTSSNEERDILASYDLGANSFLRKPVDFVAFLESARQLGVYWLTMNELPPGH
ncbi:MAG TPA: response regulator [Polyangiaceae bacterium]|jgi:two-component system response regulator